MNINGLQSYGNIIQGGNAPEINNAAKAENAAALGSAAEGSVITGEVVSVNGRNVQLRLPSAQIVTARLEADVALSAGQSMAFTVKSNSGSQIALTPMFGSNAVNPSAIKALTQAAIMINDATLDMAEAMMEQGLSVDKNALMAMHRLTGKYPEANPADIVAMCKQGIPLSQDNIEQFALYRNNQHQIIALSEEISDGVARLSESLEGKSLSDMISVFNGNSSTELTQEMSNTLKESIQANNAANSETALSGDGAAFLKALGSEAGSDTLLNQINTSLSSAKESTTAAENTNESDITGAEGNNSGALARILSSDQLQQLGNTLQQLGVSTEAVNSIINGSMEPTTALSYIQSALGFEEKDFKALGMSDEEARDKSAIVKELAKSSAVSSLLKQSVMDRFSLKPDEEFNKDTAKGLYEKILKDTDKVSQLLDKLGQSDSTLAKSLDSLKANVSFMNQLNETFTYMQIPLQLAGENGNGDLYVYTNKKNLAKRDGDITALLHLEMENLGNLDIHVTLSGDNNVKTNFMLQDEDILDFVEANIHILDERLQSRGYNADIKTTLKSDKEAEDKNPAISAMLGKGENTKNLLLSKYSFDVKA